MAKLKKSVSGFGAYRAARTRALGAAQLLPLTGDGPQAKKTIGYLDGQRLFGPMNPTLYDRRRMLVAARYRDWLAERDARLDDRGLRAA